MLQNTRSFLLTALIAAAALSSCSKTDSMESTAGAFLSSIKEGNIDKAYDMTSPTLQKITTKDQLKNFTSTLGLSEYKDVRWLGHVAIDSSAYVEGLLTVKDSIKVSIKLHLHQTQGSWKISGMERLPGFGLSGNISSGFPSDMMVRNLVANWITMLDRAIRAGDFGEFYSNMSRLGQQTTTKELLTQGFKSFVEQKINVAAALNAQASVVPYLSGDAPNQARILLVESLFQTEPVGLSIVMKFTPEGGQWKLVAMNLNVVPKPQS